MQISDLERKVNYLGGVTRPHVHIKQRKKGLPTTDSPFHMHVYYTLVKLLSLLRAACAAASLAIGTRNGEQDT